MTLAHPDPVSEELAVRDLVNRYADAVCRQDAAAVAELFTAGGKWIVTGYGRPEGHAEIAAFLDGLLEHWASIVHALLSGRVHLDPTDPDRATGRWYISEFGRQADGTEVLFAGVYHDEYVRDAGIWRFGRRRYDSMFRRVGDTLTTSPFPADAPDVP
ncbi:MAG: nuclear transport factor 2 family protein [Acidimicrobiia bacterium]|jgi:ketosteroid isomerase-like protein